MKVIVTGAAGHIGQSLVRYLCAQGCDVYALVYRQTHGLEGLGIQCVKGDLSEPESLAQAFCGADLVFHAAGYISLLPDDWQHLAAVNITGVKNVLNACKACHVRRVVHFSTIEVFDRTDDSKPINEATPQLQHEAYSLYAYSKICGELLVKHYIEEGNDAIILNPSGCIGPYDYHIGSATDAIIDLCEQKLPVLVQGAADWVDVRDVASAAWRAALDAPAGRQYILSGAYRTVQDLAEAVSVLTGARMVRFYLPLSLVAAFLPISDLYFKAIHKVPVFTRASLNALAGNWQVSHQRATKELGYQPRPFLESLRDGIDWLQTENMVRPAVK